MKLTPGEERALLRRLEEAGVPARDVLVIEALLDEASNASLLQAIREMTVALSESATAETATSTELAVWREKLTPLLERTAAAEEERNRLQAAALVESKAQAELELARTELAKIQEQEAGKTRRVTIERIVAVVVAVLGAVGTLAGYFFGASG